MGVAERRTRQKQALRDEILGAARQLFVKEGYDGVSMRRIAEKIEYSPTTIYLHFKDKADLLFELCQETFAKLIAELQSIAKKHEDPLDMLREGLRAYIHFGLNHPQHYLATFVIPHEQAAPDMHEKYCSGESEGMKALEYLRACVEACVKAGKLRALDLDVATRSLWAAVHGLTSLMIVHPFFPWGDREKVIDGVVETMLEGMKPAG